MSPDISERAFEEAIECVLLQDGPDACPGDATAVREPAPPYGEEPLPGGYRKRRPEDFDPGLYLIPTNVIDFLLATQPKEWEKLKQHHGSDVKERFLARLSREIGGRAKAMIVTRSRLHAVRYKLALDKYLAEHGHPWKSLVAFSGTVQDRGESYTESGMNSAGLGRVTGERQTAAEFEKPEYRFLVVANKFQTGFDQPLLHTMYVDKKLGGVNAVQTLSRLNRTHPQKKSTMVLDFANEAEEIRKAFEPYYETTLLSEATDPNLLYEVQGRLLDFGVYTEADVGAFAKVYFNARASQDRLYAALEPACQRFSELSPEEQQDFRSQLTDY